MYLKNIEWYIKHRKEEEMPTSSIFEDIVISSEYAEKVAEEFLKHMEQPVELNEH